MAMHGRLVRGRLRRFISDRRADRLMGGACDVDGRCIERMPRRVQRRSLHRMDSGRASRPLPRARSSPSQADRSPIWSSRSGPRDHTCRSWLTFGGTPCGRRRGDRLVVFRRDRTRTPDAVVSARRLAPTRRACFGDRENGSGSTVASTVPRLPHSPRHRGPPMSRRQDPRTAKTRWRRDTAKQAVSTSASSPLPDPHRPALSMGMPGSDGPEGR